MSLPFKRKNGTEQLSIDEILGGIKKEAAENPAKRKGKTAPDNGGFGDSFDDDFDSFDGGDFGFGPQEKQPAPPPAESAPTAPTAGGLKKRFSRGAPAAPTEFDSEKPAPPLDDFDMMSQPAAQRQQPVMPQPKPAPTVRPVKAAPAEVVSVDGGKSLFGQLKAKLSGAPEDDGVIYYTPPEGYAPNRARYKRTNHHPIPMWLKSALLAAALAFVIFTAVKLTFYGMMIGGTNFVDDTQHASVRLTLDESQAMQAQLSEEETNDVTLPGLAIRSNDKIQTILLVGTSAAVGSGDAGECDSIVLVAIDNEHKKIKLTSIARELYASIPDYHNNMIGETYFYDSASGNRTLALMREVIEQNLCVKIDNIVMIDYDSLQAIVNKLGGVNLTVTNEEALYMSTDKKYGSFPRYIAGGLYTMTGNELLNYLRMINIGEKTDAERTARLRGVLRTMTEDLGSRSNVKRAAAVYSVLPYITTDMNSRDIYSLVTNAKKYCNKYELCGYTLPVNGSWDYDDVEINGETKRVVVASYAFNAEYLQKFIYDDDLTYTYGNSVTGVSVPYISEEAKAAALAEENAE